MMMVEPDLALMTILDRFGVQEWSMAKNPSLGSSASQVEPVLKKMDECLRLLITCVTEVPPDVPYDVDPEVCI